MIEHHDEIKEVLTYPPNYWGSLTEWIDSGYGPTFTKHRDSEALDRSNYDSIEQLFREKFEYGLDFVTDSANHWAVGWIEQIVVRVLDCGCDDDVVQDRVIRYNGMPTEKTWYCDTCGAECKPTAIFIETLEILAALSDYPVFNEEHYSNLETEEMMEWLEQEVGSDHADALWRHLYDNYSACRPEDVHYKWIEEWKEQNIVDTDDLDA